MKEREIISLNSGFIAASFSEIHQKKLSESQPGRISKKTGGVSSTAKFIDLK